MAWLICLILLTAPLQLSIRGILLAPAKNKQIFLTNTVLNFLLYLFLIWLLAFQLDYKTKGLLYSILITNSANIIFYLVLVNLENWHEEATKRHAKMYEMNFMHTDPLDSSELQTNIRDVLWFKVLNYIQINVEVNLTTSQCQISLIACL